ncbi:hypothetical protein ZHAS_00017526 [Anopheles sinensis]|uniref:Uncharacterized protein n=1 Tax=Anopheles sinensis TaxID=74873 RepID=A0A084WGS9_ANOSI|nr:hypothetical protein ZHAS_00017526 [Anopheles sinensis]
MQNTPRPGESDRNRHDRSIWSASVVAIVRLSCVFFVHRAANNWREKTLRRSRLSAGGANRICTIPESAALVTVKRAKGGRWRAMATLPARL